MSVADVELPTVYRNKVPGRVSWNGLLESWLLSQKNLAYFCTLGTLFLSACGVDGWSSGRNVLQCPEEMKRSGIQSHRVIRLGGGRDQEHLLPSQVEINEGESIKFISLDHRLHSLLFLSDSLSPEMARFLSETRQFLPAPLMNQGDCLELNFNDAPPGRYVFVSRGHGDPVYGRIVVQKN